MNDTADDIWNIYRYKKKLGASSIFQLLIIINTKKQDGIDKSR